MSAISRCRVSLIGNGANPTGIDGARRCRSGRCRAGDACSSNTRILQWSAALACGPQTSRWHEPATVGVLIGRPTDGATHQWAKTMSGS